MVQPCRAHVSNNGGNAQVEPCDHESQCLNFIMDEDDCETLTLHETVYAFSKFTGRLFIVALASEECTVTIVVALLCHTDSAADKFVIWQRE